KDGRRKSREDRRSYSRSGKKKAKSHKEHGDRGSGYLPSEEGTSMNEDHDHMELGERKNHHRSRKKSKKHGTKKARSRSSS
ncbi:unnamed protein product, partial [Amoebophrya sp. A25]